MLMANEIRIGDYFSYEGKVIQIDENQMEVLMGARNYDDYKPIPITGDVLIKSGFKEFQYYLDIKTFINYEAKIFIGESGGWLHHTYGPDSAVIISKNVVYLHQLQNLYFALINEELKIFL